MSIEEIKRNAEKKILKLNILIQLADYMQNASNGCKESINWYNEQLEEEQNKPEEEKREWRITDLEENIQKEVSCLEIWEELLNKIEKL